jgi:hypothetical protein
MTDGLRRTREEIVCSYQQRSRGDMNRMTAKNNPVIYQGYADKPTRGGALESGKI